MKNKLAKYSVDNYNRLIINRYKETFIPQGSFSVDKDNRLVFWLNEPAAWRKKYRFPAKIIFTGKWKLSDNYDLEFEFKKYKSAAKQVLSLKGEIIAAESERLVFEIATFSETGLLPKGASFVTRIRILKLSGYWGANDSNQLYFAVNKNQSSDILTLKAGWQINQNQEITYSYQKTNLLTKEKIVSGFTFFGFWQVGPNSRLTYILSSGNGSKFDFKAQLESPNIYPEKGAIKYRLGTGISSNRKNNQKIISLYGVWKLDRRIGLTFEMAYSDQRIYSLEFAAEVNFDKNNQVSFKIKNKMGEDLGFSVIFTHKLLKKLDAEVFLRLKHFQEESGIDAGLSIPF